MKLQNYRRQATALASLIPNRLPLPERLLQQAQRQIPERFPWGDFTDLLLDYHDDWGSGSQQLSPLYRSLHWTRP